MDNDSNASKGPRPWTGEELAGTLAGHLDSIAVYWADLAQKGDRNGAELIDCSAFSMCAALDGSSGGCPKFLFMPENDEVMVVANAAKDLARADGHLFAALCDRWTLCSEKETDKPSLTTLREAMADPVFTQNALMLPNVPDAMLSTLCMIDACAKACENKRWGGNNARLRAFVALFCACADGMTAFPRSLAIADPHPDDLEFCKSEGSNWHRDAPGELRDLDSEAPYHDNVGRVFGGDLDEMFCSLREALEMESRVKKAPATRRNGAPQP